MTDGGLRLEPFGGRPTMTHVAEINAAMAPFGTRLWPLDLTGAPSATRELLRKPALTDDEVAEVRDHFLLPRARLLEIITQAGRSPQVSGGGAMSTVDATHPQLYVIEPDVDYSRFDRFHENTADDGTSVDEVMKVLSGGGVRLMQRLPDGVSTLHISCAGDDAGWIVTYGGYPHIGSFTGGQPGSKMLVQVIGPPRWQMRYDDEG